MPNPTRNTFQFPLIAGDPERFPFAILNKTGNPLGWIDDQGVPQGTLAPITSGSGVTPVSVLPATCTAGQIFQLPSGALVTCGPAVNQFTAGPSQVIDMKAYGVVADLRTCIGSIGSLTSGSPIFTCTGANFCNGTTVPCLVGQTSDVGKRINGTEGCCNNSVPVNTNTQAIPSNTTILSVQSSTQVTMSANATVTLHSNHGLYVFWATDDDANVAAADLAYQTSPTCSALLWPATPFLVRSPHFNTPNPQCEQLESSGGVDRIASGSYVGWGSNNSVMYLDSAFNFAACTFGNNSNGCFFSYNGVHIQHLGISGGWNQVLDAGGHSSALVNPGTSAEITDVRTVGFASGDGTTVGWNVSGFSNLLDVYASGFGNTGMNYNGASTVIRGGEFSNTNGPCAIMNGSTGSSPIITQGLSFGTCGGPTVEVFGGPWYSYADYLYANGPGNANGTVLYLVGGNGVLVFMDGGTVGGNGAGSTNAVLGVSGAKLFLTNTEVIAATNALNLPSGSFVYDLGGNAFTGAMNINSGATYLTHPSSTFTNASGITPTCVSTTGGGSSPSCSLQTGSTNEKGTIIITTGTGSPGTTGTITLTFAGTFQGSSSATPSCSYTINNSGTAWGNQAGVQINSQSKTAPVIAWQNTASGVLTALATASPYYIDYVCVPR